MLLVITLAMILLYIFTLPQSRTLQQFRNLVRLEKKAAGMKVEEEVAGNAEKEEKGEDKPEQGQALCVM